MVHTTSSQVINISITQHPPIPKVGNYQYLLSLLCNTETKSIAEFRKNVQEWLSPPDVSKNYRESLVKRCSTTGSWFIDGPEFGDWMTKPASLLWLHGGSESSWFIFFCGGHLMDINSWLRQNRFEVSRANH
jgi:hypothetical protein